MIPVRAGRVAACLAIALGVSISAANFSAAQDCRLPSVSSDGWVEYSFLDASGQENTGWRVRTAISASGGLIVDEALFRTAAAQQWKPVLSDARVAEIFVPYHSGYPRFYDTNYFSLVRLNQRDLGACAVIPASQPHVAYEVRDRGILWKQYGDSFRAKDLTIWSAMGAGNYNYLISYSFLADGTIEMRAAGTAQNLPGAEMEAHTHTVLWRIDIDLNGPANDTAYLRRHQETHGGHLTAKDLLEPVNGGREGPLDFEDSEFPEVRIVDTALNGLSHQNSYDFRPVRRGAARHYGSGEEFSQHDAWVLRSNPAEVSVRALTSYVDGQSIANEDLVVWIQTPLHHEPRDEDGYLANGLWNGVALAMWGGVDLRPRNIFDGTPFYP